MQSIFNFFGSVFLGAQGAGTLLPNIGILLKEDNGALLLETGGFILLQNGTEFSNIPSFYLQNGNNIIQLHNAGFL